MNNKGQTLALFIVILPILAMLVVFIYDIGRMTLLRSELDDINYMAISYGLDNISSIDNNKLEEIIKKNKNDIDKISININDGKIEILLEDNIKNNFKILSNTNMFKVKSSYYGYLNEDKKIIERD